MCTIFSQEGYIIVKRKQGTHRCMLALQEWMACHYFQGFIHIFIDLLSWGIFNMNQIGGTMGGKDQ